MAVSTGKGALTGSTRQQALPKTVFERAYKAELPKARPCPAKIG